MSSSQFKKGWAGTPCSTVKLNSLEIARWSQFIICFSSRWSWMAYTVFFSLGWHLIKTSTKAELIFSGSRSKSSLISIMVISLTVELPQMLNQEVSRNLWGMNKLHQEESQRHLSKKDWWWRCTGWRGCRSSSKSSCICQSSPTLLSWFHPTR